MDLLIIMPGSDADQFYATGLRLHGTFITLVRGNKRIIAAGGFEYPQAKALYPSAVSFSSLGKTWPEVLKAFCQRYKVDAPVLPRQTPAHVFVTVKKLLPKAKLASGDLFAERAIKTSEEQRALKAVQQTTQGAIAIVRDELARSTVLRGTLRVGGKALTSESLKRLAAQKLAEANCSCPDMIIASGAQSALPHHEGAGPLKANSIVVDIFPKSNDTGYFGDCTRTYSLAPPKTFAERYDALQDTHSAVLKKIKPGANKLDTFSREKLAQKGFVTENGQGYIHSLGHGIGLDIHENPRLNDSLREGNAITIEPGLYYEYGIRIEDMGVVTKTGFRNYTSLDKNPYL